MREEKRTFAYQIGFLSGRLTDLSTKCSRDFVSSRLSVFERGRNLVQDVLDYSHWVRTGEKRETSSGRNVFEKSKLSSYLANTVFPSVSYQEMNAMLGGIKNSLGAIIKDLQNITRVLVNFLMRFQVGLRLILHLRGVCTEWCNYD